MVRYRAGKERSTGQHRFILVDVFTHRPLAGNPLAVFPDGAALSDEEMQAVAREFGHSETTFVVEPRQRMATWRLRCFTPRAEVFGAGHNALGAWWVLASIGKVRLNEQTGLTVVQQELGDRVLAVEVSHAGQTVDRVLMTQGAPHLGSTIDDLEALGGALGLAAQDLQVAGLRPRAVSTGATHLLVPARDLDALRRIRVDADRLLRLVRPVHCEGAYVFTMQTVEPGSLAHARAFFPGIGIVEDPATGSAAGPLGALLAAHGYLPADKVAIIEQGDEMDRPSRIEVRVQGERVQVGGRAAVVAEGLLTL